VRERVNLAAHKSEIRRPKSEGNPKSEIRNQLRIAGKTDALEPRGAAARALPVARLPLAAFGFRISDFRDARTCALLVHERLDGVEAGGLEGGKEAGEDPDGGAEGDGQDRGHGGDEAPFLPGRFIEPAPGVWTFLLPTH
jgi:hypothetical protein